MTNIVDKMIAVEREIKSKDIYLGLLQLFILPGIKKKDYISNFTYIVSFFII